MSRAGAPGDILLRGTEITRRWGGLVAVDRVSIELQRGTVHAVIGTNGAGKSTLINILSGEIAPSGGSVELLGQDVTAWTQPRRARAGLGHSYQRNTIFPDFTVFENCRLAAQARQQKSWAWWIDARRCAFSSDAARDAAARAGLADLLDHPAEGLSHGQKRQLEIAMCLATAPEVLLLDEPCSALDPISTGKIEELIHELKADYTVVIVTHNMQQAARCSDYTAYMYLGDLVEFGRTPELFMQPKKKDTEDYITGRFG